MVRLVCLFQMHIVTYNSDKHADINSVLESDDSTGLAVLGVLFEVIRISMIIQETNSCLMCPVSV